MSWMRWIDYNLGTDVDTRYPDIVLFRNYIYNVYPVIESIADIILFGRVGKLFKAHPWAHHQSQPIPSQKPALSLRESVPWPCYHIQAQAGWSMFASRQHTYPTILGPI
jgi:hypothetical protein